MGPTMKDLGIDKLSIEQRSALAREIRNSLDDTHAVPPLGDAFMAELDRRDAAMDANPDLGDSWDDVKAHLDAQR